jgi:hypothetical protein
MSEIAILTAKDVGKMFGAAPETVTKCILNGTFPVGLAYKDANGARTIVLKNRLDLWLAGADLSLGVKMGDPSCGRGNRNGGVRYDA